MTLVACLPLLLSVIGPFSAPLIVRSLPPWHAARLLTAMTVSTAASTTATLVLVVLASVDSGLTRHVASLDTGAPPTAIAAVLEWCGQLYDHRAPSWGGIVAAGLLVLAAVRMVRTRLRWRRAVLPWRHSGPLEIVPGPATDAFAVPGRPGTVVVGQGLLDALDADEQRVVLAHEQAHLRAGHHRHLQAADLAAAALPFLEPIARQIRLATERWADEAAADAVGDRPLVARAIIKAALASPQATPLAAAATGNIICRVDALLCAEPGRRDRRRRVVTTPASLLSAAVTVAAASVEVHHLLVVLQHAGHGHL